MSSLISPPFLSLLIHASCMMSLSLFYWVVIDVTSCFLVNGVTSCVLLNYVSCRIFVSDVIACDFVSDVTFCLVSHYLCHFLSFCKWCHFLYFNDWVRVVSLPVFYLTMPIHVYFDEAFLRMFISTENFYHY